MRDTRVDTVVIGGGQAGLAAGYYLKRQDRDFVILDANTRVGESWHQRFPGLASHYPTKDEMAGYLEVYAARFELPMRLGVRVLALTRDDQVYVLATTAGRLEARQVIVATGAYRTPRRPAFANQLDPAVKQLHSVEYRNPSQLHVGPVLIVGAGNSGAEIAMDLASTHRVWLSGRHPGHIPAGYTSSARSHQVAKLVVGMALRLTADTWPGRWALGKAWVFMGGHPVVRVQPQQLKTEGIQRVPRMAGVQAGQPLLADGRVLGTANVIWCTGFGRDFSWIRLPIFDANGVPRHHRGVVRAEPGLYLLGLPFQSSVLSGIVASAGPDAQYVVKQIAKRAKATSPVHQLGGLPV
jgi:putative flavoprotein involved in K+ transport